MKESENPRGDRLRAACEAVGIRSLRGLAEHLKSVGAEKGFSYAKLVKISNGTATLSPQDAEFIARSLGLSSTFFTAPLSRLGDVLAGPEGVAARPSPPEPMRDLFFGLGWPAALDGLKIQLATLDRRLGDKEVASTDPSKYLTWDVGSDSLRRDISELQSRLQSAEDVPEEVAAHLADIQLYVDNLATRAERLGSETDGAPIERKRA